MSLLDDVLGKDGLTLPNRRKLRFKDWQSMCGWLQNEADTWGEIETAINAVQTLHGTALHQVFTEQTQGFKAVLHQINIVTLDGQRAPRELQTKAELFLASLVDGTIPLSDSRIGKLIFRIADLGSVDDEDEARLEVRGDPAAAAGLLLLTRQEGLKVGMGGLEARDVMPDLAGIIRGWERVHSIKDLVNAETAAFGDLKDKLEAAYTKRVTEIGSELEALTKDLDSARSTMDQSNADFDTEMNERRKALADYEDHLRTKLATESAVKLWDDAASRHKERGYLALISFILLGILGIGAVIQNLDWITANIGNQQIAGSLTIITLPALALAWTMRLASRVFVQSGNARSDAEIRKAQAETFLALAADEKIGVSDTERILILNALFRPAGASADDDAPPPNLVELLTRQPRGPGN